MGRKVVKGGRGIAKLKAFINNNFVEIKSNDYEP